MPAAEASVRSTTELVSRAAAISLNSARIIARSIELITRSQTIVQTVVRAHAVSGTVLAETQQIGTRPHDKPAKPRFTRHIDRVGPLPLTPARLLELAEEFRVLARNSDTPESRAAFEGLVFRYTALAAGYDDVSAGSRRLH